MLPTYAAKKHTTNELLFDTYVNNKVLNGMPSAVAFYYQLVYFCIIIFMSTNVICMDIPCQKALGNITTQTCCPLMWPQKTKQTR